MLQNDGIGRARNLHVLTNGFSALEQPVVETAERYQEPITVRDDIPLTSDNWSFAKHGVPSYYMASETDDGEPMYGINAETVYTKLDTLEKLDPRDLKRCAIWESDLVVELASDEFEVAHMETDEVQAHLADQNKDFEDWVFPVI